MNKFSDHDPKVKANLKLDNDQYLFEMFEFLKWSTLEKFGEIVNRKLDLTK